MFRRTGAALKTLGFLRRVPSPEFDHGSSGLEQLEQHYSRARLTSLTLERFKSFKGPETIELAPLNLIVGRNNSGKSTLIQSLLLLQQTLRDPDPSVTLRLEGLVDAFSLRELTYGWPRGDGHLKGPSITLRWKTMIRTGAVLKRLGDPKTAYLAKLSGIGGLEAAPESLELETELCLETEEWGGEAKVRRIQLRSLPSQLRMAFDRDDFPFWSLNESSLGLGRDGIMVEMDHFLPTLDRTGARAHARSRMKAAHNLFSLVFKPALAALNELLSDFHYLGASRQFPPSLFKAATSLPAGVGVSGEFAAQLMHRKRMEAVTFLPPATISPKGRLQPSELVVTQSLVQAVNSVLHSLGIETPLSIEEVQEIGFRVLFGEASITHVGRGLVQLLPVIVQGLMAEPLRVKGHKDYHWLHSNSLRDEPIELSVYQKECRNHPLLALEEPEAHVHPKVASRLAHWFVSLAQTQRQLLVETHSDHLVRRLRGMVARAEPGSELEGWLMQNVLIHSIEQDHEGASTVTTHHLTAEGGIKDVWPTDFMDESSEEESAIFYARLDKESAPIQSTKGLKFVSEPEPEQEQAP